MDYPGPGLSPLKVWFRGLPKIPRGWTYQEAPFVWILAASALVHGGLLGLGQGTVLFPRTPQKSTILPATFGAESSQPTIESSPGETVYYRIPIPADKGSGATTSPRTETVPSPTPSASTATSPPPSLPGVNPVATRGTSSYAVPAPASKPVREGPVPAAWTRALETGLSRGAVFFGRPFSGRSVVFAVDISGSMLEKSGKSTRLREAYDGVMQALGGLEPSQRFNILLYADRVDSFRPENVPAERSTVLEAFRYLESDIDCGGSTNLQEALRRALALQPEVILLLSDGEANSEDSAILAEVRFLRSRQAHPVRIDTVGFYLQAGSRPELLLKKIASENGGDYAAWNPRGSTTPPRR